MTASPLVLITGSSGRIGRAAVAELLARGRPVRGFDRVATPGVAEMVVGEITDGDAVRRAMQGVGSVIHLAATPDDDDFLTMLLGPNVVGTYHVLEAARAAGVQRAILASSGQVVWNQRLVGPWPIGPDVQPSPRYWYAATKVFLEAAGRAFADAKYIPNVLAIRLGWCPRTPEQVQEISEQDWAQDVYLSPGDAGRFFACCVEAKVDRPFAILYATSRPTKMERLALEPARKLVGYEPRDCWPEGREIVTGKKE